MRLVQLLDPELRRRVARVEDDRLRLIEGLTSVYALALAAVDSDQKLRDVVISKLSGDTLEYASVWAGDTDWSFLPAFDHPDERARCLVSGTGLTHLAGAKNRDSMHADQKPAAVTDSMRMYQWGVEGGTPPEGQIGTQPEWFYKGNGHVLRGHNEALEVPAFADDGGEEPEIAGAYIIDWSGAPRRVGMAIGNEFSDHQMERKNYLYLAPSKLRTCALGPELVLEPDFNNVRGVVRIERAGETVWSKALATGSENMCHSLANMEHHHFKYTQHCEPGDVHIHFFGTGAFSFGEGIALENGDIMDICFDGFGRSLRNPIRIDRSACRLAEVRPL